MSLRGCVFAAYDPRGCVFAAYDPTVVSVLTVFPLDWGMLRRSRRVLFIIRTLTVFVQSNRT